MSVCHYYSRGHQQPTVNRPANRSLIAATITIHISTWEKIQKDYTHSSAASSMCNPNIFTKKIFPIIKSIKKLGVISYSPRKSLTGVGSSIPQWGSWRELLVKTPFREISIIHSTLHNTKKKNWKHNKMDLERKVSSVWTAHSSQIIYAPAQGYVLT